jgi:soluble lytic murein transglycosylase-like protein
MTPSKIGATQFDDLFFEKAAWYSVPYTWVKAIAGAESDYNPNAYREEPQINDASRGLMQVLERTARALGYQGTADGLFDPATSVDLGTKLLAENIQRFGKDFQRVYSAYNSGSATAYLSNSTVKAHVDRAVSYLRAVEAGLEQASTTGETPDTLTYEDETEKGPG